MRHFLSTIVLATISLVFVHASQAQARALSEILASVEAENLGTIVEVEWSDGLLEVEIDNTDGKLTLYLDPASGEERRRKQDSERVKSVPPAGSLPLSQIVRRLEQEHSGARFSEIEFDDGRWEVELRVNGRKIEMKIDPRTGEQVD